MYIMHKMLSIHAIVNHIDHHKDIRDEMSYTVHNMKHKWNTMSGQEIPLEIVDS